MNCTVGEDAIIKVLVDGFGEDGRGAMSSSFREVTLINNSGSESRGVESADGEIAGRGIGRDMKVAKTKWDSIRANSSR